MPDSALNQLLHGSGAHADALACIAGLSAPLAGRLAPNFPHTVYALVFHLNYWIEYDLKRLRGERPPYPEHAEESWPPELYPSELEWKEECQRFAARLQELDRLANSGDLQRQAESLHPAHDKLASSLEAILWQTIVHNSYHLGQIAMLRRMLGAWPPPGGGDTW